MISRILIPPKPKRGRALPLAVGALVVVVLFGFWAAVFGASKGDDQGVAAVREAVVRATDECLAVEGGYGPSLSYLEENYGLRVNHVNYVVQYEAFADNVPPTIIVRPR